VTQGLAGTTAVISGIEAVNGNPANITTVHLPEVNILYSVPSGFLNIPVLSTSAVIPYKSSRLGISFSRTGTPYFNLSEAGITLSHKVDRFSLGVSGILMRYSAGEYGSGTTPVIKAGAAAAITPELIFGVFIFNLNVAGFSVHSREKLPLIAATGIAWQAAAKVKINIQLEKETRFRSALRTGIEYSPAGLICFRAGISGGNIFRFYAGAGLRYKSAQLHYAAASHPYLPVSHHLSVSTFLKKSEKAPSVADRNF
jgi:hypothetical protein